MRRILLGLCVIAGIIIGLSACATGDSRDKEGGLEEKTESNVGEKKCREYTVALGSDEQCSTWDKKNQVYQVACSYYALELQGNASCGKFNAVLCNCCSA